MSGKPIKYVFIGNLNSKKIMCQETVTHFQTTEKDATQLFQRMSLLKDFKFNEHSKVPNKNGNYYFTTLLPNKFYLVLADSNISETVVFEMMEEIHKSSIIDNVDESGVIRVDGVRYLQNIISKYQNKKTLIKDINNDINDIKIEMRNNVKAVVDNHDNLEGLQKQSEDIKHGSDLFKDNSNDLKKAACWQNWKLTIIITLVVLGIIAIIIIAVVVSKNKKSSDSTVESLLRLR
jgi:hypothetical protein